MSFHLAVFCPVVKRRAAVLALCRSYFHTRAIPCRVVSFTSYEAVLAEPFHYDAYFLPIEPPLKGQTLPEGILLAQTLRAQQMLNPIIFIAFRPEWAYEAYRVDALQYMPAPLTRQSVFSVLERAVSPEHAPIFPVSSSDGVFGIPFCQIESVECTNHVLLFRRTNAGFIRSLTLRVPLRKAIAPLLADRRFLQPHRSYVVNLAAVDQLTPHGFQMHSGSTIPVSRDRFRAVKEAYLAFLESTLPTEGASLNQL